MKRLFFTILYILLYSAEATAESIDYSRSEFWFSTKQGLDKRVDVLFFPPTSVSDSDGQGRNMNILDSKQREAVNRWYRIAEKLFGESCNYYGPYYRQVTMESWGKPYFEECYAIALGDAIVAFDYYMEHLNCGRPFILAGHSQGAKIVFDIIKRRINQGNYSRMVAAYPIGYRISAREVAECKFIRPAQNAVDLGVCVTYHTAASSDVAMFPGNAFGINPLNWSVGYELAEANANMGSVLFNNEGGVVEERVGVISAQRDHKTGCLVARGVHPSEFYGQYLGGYWFRKGNYHLQDLSFYFRNLQVNVRDRIEAYFFQVRRNS